MKPATYFQAFILVIAVGIYSSCSAQDQSEIVGSYDPEKLLITTATLNGHAVNCIIDTGSSHHVIDSSLKPSLGVCRPYAQNKNIEICGPQSLLLSGLKDSVRTVSAVTDLTPIRNSSGMDFDMVIGRPFLIDKVLEIDPEKRHFRIHRNEVEIDEKMLKMHSNEFGGMLVSVAVADQEILALLDTGSNADLTLEKCVFEQLDSVGSWPCSGESVRVDVVSIGEGTSVKKMESCSVQIGGYTIDSCTITEADINKIGFGLISRFVATIDLKNMRLKLSLPPVHR